MEPAAKTCVIRKARAWEDAAIRALVLSERMRPVDLKPENFLVAVEGDEIIGTVQMRRHSDGTHELGSLVVAPNWRRQGVARRLIDMLLKEEAQSVYMITARAHWRRYVPWGFELVSGGAVPNSIRFHHLIGSLGSIVSLFKRRSMRRLVILRRKPIDAGFPQGV
ncbi:MAG: GNAT family N-acetyltransferase [Parvibaculaceae bacterium]